MTTKETFNQARLGGLIEAIRQKPESGRTVWRASTAWQGGFRSEAKIRDFTLSMDEPDALGGTNTGPNMVEVVLGAYGCCLTTGYVANAALRGIKLEDVRIDLEGDLDLNAFLGLQSPDQCWPGYTSVRAKVTLVAPNATPEELETLHQTVIRTSPVGSILERPIQVAVERAE